MHIIGIIVGVILFIVVWWARLKMLGEVANKAVDVVDTAIKAPRRWKFQRQTSENPADTIDDPRVATVSLLYLLAASDGVLTEVEENKIKLQAIKRKLCELSEWDEYSVFGRWAAGRMSVGHSDVNKLIKKVHNLAPNAGNDLKEMVLALDKKSLNSEVLDEALIQINKSFNL